jgi:hypothetical protein
MYDFAASAGWKPATQQQITRLWRGHEEYNFPNAAPCAFSSAAFPAEAKTGQINGVSQPEQQHSSFGAAI